MTTNTIRTSTPHRGVRQFRQSLSTPNTGIQMDYRNRLVSDESKLISFTFQEKFNITAKMKNWYIF